jgi:acyl-CoA thioesterase I
VNSLVYHIASGQSFFSGIVLVIVAAALSIRRETLQERLPDELPPANGGGHLKRRASFLAFLVGSLAIAISSAAIPYWLYAAAGLVSVSWSVFWSFNRFRSPKTRWLPHAMITTWLLATVWEAPFHFTPSLMPVESREMVVIGDSITAGTGRIADSQRWPDLLANEHQLTVLDFSQAGETSGSALARLRKGGISFDSSVVLLEIGGNDLLGPTDAAQFARDLDELLTAVTSPDRQVMMLELPLPPFHNEYGLAQRRLARKHGALLIPRRVFLSVLAAEESTLDTIHLSRHGHKRMAECVWQLVRSAFSRSVDDL